MSSLTRLFALPAEETFRLAAADGSGVSHDNGAATSSVGGGNLIGGGINDG